jgi:lathosterol oxidase
MTVMTTFVFLFEVRGHSKLYDDLYSRSLLYNVLICVWFLVFTDCLIYWIHRGLHHPSVYGTFHKIHHLWIIPTPFASHAFHPVDGFLQR